MTVFRALRRSLLGALFMGVLCVITLQISNPVRATTGTNKQMNFQGRLLTSQGAVVPDGYYNIEFKIYQDGAGTSVGNPGGTLKWTEDWLNQQGHGVQIKNGYLSVQLGTVNPFNNQVDWNQDTLWLSLNIAGTNTTCTPFTNCSPDGEMVPMKRLSSVAYAMNAVMLGGKTAENFLQIAQGLQTDAVPNTPSIYINKTTTGNFLDYQQNGVGAYSVTNSGDILFGANANHTMSVATSPAGVTGKNLTISAGSASAAGAASAGGQLILQGGSAAGSGNNNGGDVTIQGGSAVGTGYNGIVNIGASSYIAGTMTACSSNCTITQGLVDNNGTVVVSATDPTVTITLPAPRNQSAGRILYVTTASTSTDFTLSANGGANALNVTMKANTTATMIWNGTAWTPGGASNAITLQATYNNGTNPSTTPEIKLDTIRGTIDIQDADVSIGQDILDVRASQPGGLGTKLFGVGYDGQVTIQGTTNNSSAFRVLDQYGNYTFNINNSNGYVISNSTTSSANEITNPGFEAGGSLGSGEEGWFGPSAGTIISSNANTGNYALSATALGANQDYYAGSYREVTAGKTYYLTGYIKQNGSANGSAGIQITWYNKDKAVIGYSTDYASAVTTSYAQRVVNATAPAGSVYAKVSGTVRATASTGVYYFDDFTFRSNSYEAPSIFQNATNSAAAFRIQSAGSAQTLFTANTTNNVLKVGDSTGTDTGTTLLVLDSTSIDPTTISGKDGGMFYNSTTNSLKAVIGGTVVDICTTAVTCSGYSASAGSVIQLQASSPGTTQVGHFNITGTGILANLKSHDSSSGNGEDLTIKSGSSTAAGGKSGNLTLDVGTGPGGTGTINIGHAGVDTTMAGGMAIQGSGIGGSVLTLGTSSSVAGSLTFQSSAGANAVTLKGPTTAGTGTAYTLNFADTLSAGCMKVNASGQIYYQDCGTGLSFDVQDAYNNGGTRSTYNNASDANTYMVLSNAKDFRIVAEDTATDPNVLINLKCVTSCGTNGRFAVQNAGTDVLAVDPAGNITLNGNVQIGSKNTDANLKLLQLDSCSAADETSPAIGCQDTLNQGALYYNTSMKSIRACVSGTWVDISNPDTLGLLTFGVIPSSGTEGYDLPALGRPGASGPCRVFWVDSQHVGWNKCTAYSGGKRINVDPSIAAGISVPTVSGASATSHLCLVGTSGQPAFNNNTAYTDASQGLPAWSATTPTLCLADVKTTTAGTISAIYDTRTFSSTMKEAVNASVNNTAGLQLGMLVDADTNGAMKPSGSASQKLYGTVIVGDSTRMTSAGTPNIIVATVGPAWVKAVAGNAGGFVISSSTGGHATTTGSIPNNSFYYSAGNTRTAFTAPTTANTACTSVSTCLGSLYVNFVVR